jgi:tetratricopeptide (TPR) repeat protein
MLSRRLSSRPWHEGRVSGLARFGAEEFKRSLFLLVVTGAVLGSGCARRLDPRAQEGHDLVLAGKIDEAIAFANSILVDEPDNAEVRNVLGMALYKAGDAEASIEQYKRALESKPKYPEAHFNLGNSLRILDRTEEALAEFETAVRLQKKFVLARYNIGKIHQNHGRIEQALAEYRQCVKDDPQFLYGFIDIGKILYDSGDYNGAATHLARALELEPSIKEMHVLLGNAYMQANVENNVALAENEYRAAVGIDSVYVDAVYSLGMSLATQNRKDEAIKWFERLLPMLEARGRPEENPMAEKVRAYFKQVGYVPGTSAATG